VRNASKWAVVGFAALLVLSFLSWEWYLAPEAQVRRTLRGAAAAAERADAATFVSFLSSDFSDFVHEDRASLETTLREGFGRIDRLNVTLRSIDVVVEGGEASARFDAVVVAIRGEERYVVLGTPFEGEKLEAALAREPDGWKIVRVSRTSGGL
jgi:hypothetical protein